MNAEQMKARVSELMKQRSKLIKTKSASPLEIPARMAQVSEEIQALEEKIKEMEKSNANS